MPGRNSFRSRVEGKHRHGLCQEVGEHVSRSLRMWQRPQVCSDTKFPDATLFWIAQSRWGMNVSVPFMDTVL